MTEQLHYTSALFLAQSHTGFSFMQENEVIAAVSAAVADAQVQVRFEGNHVHLRVISPAFTGLSPLKKQQLVYAALKDAIASGAIHAVHMQTLTPEQWAAQAH